MPASTQGTGFDIFSDFDILGECGTGDENEETAKEELAQYYRTA